MNGYYAELAHMIESSNNINETLNIIKSKLIDKLEHKYSNCTLSVKEEVKKEEIEEILSMVENQKGGKQVRGRRVLKNGAVAGYVKQKNGKWKWSFLKRN